MQVGLIYGNGVSSLARGIKGFQTLNYGIYSADLVINWKTDSIFFALGISFEIICGKCFYSFSAVFFLWILSLL